MGIYTLVLLLFLSAGRSAYSAICCGGGSSLPSLILGDYQGQVNLIFSNAAVTYDSDTNGNLVARNNDQKEVIETLTLKGAYLLNPYWQIGLTLPYKVQSYQVKNREETSRGIGDIKLQVAYEFLPEFSYSPWKPRGYVFLEQSVPVEKSIYNSTMPLRSDALGSGFHSTALGIALYKMISNFDLLAMAEVHQPYARTFKSSGRVFKVSSDWGTSFMIGAGVSPWSGNLRIGGVFIYAKEGKRTLSGDINSQGKDLSYLEAGMDVSYLLDNYSFSLTYRDQSFLANAKNTTLTQSLSLSVIRFFEL